MICVSSSALPGALKDSGGRSFEALLARPPPDGERKRDLGRLSESRGSRSITADYSQRSTTLDIEQPLEMDCSLGWLISVRRGSDKIDRLGRGSGLLAKDWRLKGANRWISPWNRKQRGNVFFRMAILWGPNNSGLLRQPFFCSAIPEQCMTSRTCAMEYEGSYFSRMDNRNAYTNTTGKKAWLYRLCRLAPKHISE